MTNHYENCKNTVVEDIIANLEKVDILTLYDIRRELEERKPKCLREYIDEAWDSYSKGFRDDLEHEIRMMWLKTGPGCRPSGHLITQCCDCLENWTDIRINGIDPDFWVMEQGTSFNPADIANAIFHIYIGKVVFL